ncbi:MAG TPA: nuclear transport factor 2 family protein [Hyphomicrobiales bacterium]|nr:nuclear transport factor 2 family protein [Rhodobiaceae bacterium]HXK54842.1 nuclear transport factor 2 family protein [Hyphomicrobiales bacterium]
MSEKNEVLAANEAFYRAFAAADLGAMDAMIARAHPVAIIHPGWPAISGRASVMETWRMIFAEGPQETRPVNPEVYLCGDSAFVIVYEGMGGVFLVATNIFVREDGEWRLAHHQAGPIPSPSPDAPLM